MKELGSVAKAFGTRKIIALSLTLLFIYLSLKDRIDSVQVTTIYGVIIGFYFGRSTALDDPMRKVSDNIGNRNV